MEREMKGNFNNLKRPALSVALAAILSAATGAAMAQSPTVVRIGVLGPLTGDLAYAGQYQLRGAQLKAAQINAQQKAIKIEIIAEDDESKCDRSVSAARKLITRDKIHALLGAWQSTCTIAVVPITKQAKIPQYTTSVAGPVTRQNSEWIFRVGLQTSALNRATIEYAAKTLNVKRFAILSSNEELGKALAQTSEAVLKDMKLPLVAKEEFARGDRDFSGQLGRIKSANADAIILGTGIQEPAIVVRQAREMGLKVQLLGGDTVMGNPKFVELAGRDIEGAIFATVFIPADNVSGFSEFIGEYRKMFGDTPDPWAGQFYDAVGIIYEAVKANKNVADAQQIGAYTRSLNSLEKNYPGLLGKVHFDNTGEGIWPPIIGEITSANPPRWKVLNR